VIAVLPSFAQDDSLTTQEIPSSPYQQYVYNPQLKSKMLLYNYSNLWDFDNDGIKDYLLLIGNGGAHTYYYLCITVSSESRTKEYPSVMFDMPYIKAFGDSPNNIYKTTQIIAADFDKNGSTDLYLNFNNSFSYIPVAWKRKGIRKKTILLYYKNKEMKIKSYSPF
jgi:hypothetical protein